MITVAVIAVSIFWLCVAVAAYHAGKKAATQGAFEAAGVEWINDWVTLTIPNASFRSLERSIIDRDIIEIDLTSGAGIAMRPQLCRNKPTVLLQDLLTRSEPSNAELKGTRA